MADKEITRLSVNLNGETADALRDLAASKGISITEAVRRAISLTAFIESEIRAGRQIHTVKANGKKRRELIIQ